MKHLTKEQRYQIKAYLDCGKSKKFIAEGYNNIKPICLSVKLIANL